MQLHIFHRARYASSRGLGEQGTLLTSELQEQDLQERTTAVDVCRLGTVCLSGCRSVLQRAVTAVRIH